MPTVKEKMSEIIQVQPDDSSFDEILRELAFSCMVAVNWTAEAERWLRHNPATKATSAHYASSG